MLQAGGTIGIFGGGQLGRMLAMAAAQLGYRVHVYTPERDSVAAEVAAEATIAPFTDPLALHRFAQECDVLTFEFENISTGQLAFLADRLAPNLRALETAQDRLKEKRFAESLGGRPAPFASVESADELSRAIERVGAPGILKTARDGYDGKGQWRLASARDADAIRLPQGACVYEGLVRFEGEFSVILVQSLWPPSQTIADQVAEARALAGRIAETLGYVGVLTVEFFATQNGPVFNEMAPRVHNSGHWTIEGAATSQFENHIRAIAGLPLGDTATIVGRMAMDNLVGEAGLEALSDPAAHVHLYGKREAREGRKMGHVTRVWR